MNAETEQVKASMAETVQILEHVMTIAEQSPAIKPEGLKNTQNQYHSYMTVLDNCRVMIEGGYFERHPDEVNSALATLKFVQKLFEGLLKLIKEMEGEQCRIQA